MYSMSHKMWFAVFCFAMVILSILVELFVTMVVADVLVPNRHQTISNHHLDSTVLRCHMKNPHLNKLRLVARKFLCYWRVRLLMVITPYVHYIDVIMGAMASQITSLFSVYSTVYSGADQNFKAPRHWSLCGEFTVDRWFPRTNG